MAQETKDWDLHPEKYLTEEDGVTFKLTKAGLPRKKGGRPKVKHLIIIIRHLLKLR